MPTSDQLIADNVGGNVCECAEGSRDVLHWRQILSAIKYSVNSVDCKKMISDKFLSEFKKAKSYLANKTAAAHGSYYHGQIPNCLDSIHHHACGSSSGNYPAVISSEGYRKAARA